MSADDDSHGVTEAADADHDMSMSGDTILDIVTDQIAAESQQRPPSADDNMSMSGDTILDIVTDQIAAESQQRPPSAKSQQAVVDLLLSEWAGYEDVTPPTEAELNRLYRQDAGQYIPDAGPDLDFVRVLANTLTSEPEDSELHKSTVTTLRDIVNNGEFSTDTRKLAIETLSKHLRLHESSLPEPSATNPLVTALAHIAAHFSGAKRESALAQLWSMANDEKESIDTRNEARKQLKLSSDPSLTGVQSTQKPDPFSGDVPEAFGLSFDEFLPLVRSTFSDSKPAADLWIKKYRAHNGMTD